MSEKDEAVLKEEINPSERATHWAQRGVVSAVAFYLGRAELSDEKRDEILKEAYKVAGEHAAKLDKLPTLLRNIGYSETTLFLKNVIASPGTVQSKHGAFNQIIDTLGSVSKFLEPFAEQKELEAEANYEIVGFLESQRK